MDAEAWDERYADTELVWGLEPNRFVRAQCERLPIGRAVDLACGEGRNALWLARMGWKALGLDFSAVAIERAQALTEKERPSTAARLTWQVADVTTTPIKPGAYDLALISYLHLPPDQNAAVFRSAAHGLAPRGRLIVVGHDRRNLREGVSGPQDESRLYDAGTHPRGARRRPGPRGRARRDRHPADRRRRRPRHPRPGPPTPTRLSSVTAAIGRPARPCGSSATAAAA